MINYTQNEIDIKKIIINYKIENNKIKVKYADISKEEKIYNYSKEKELEIKDTIKKQLNNYDIVKKILKNKIKNSSIWIIILGLIIFFNINMLINSYANIVAWISLFLMGISTYINVTNMKEYISKLNDLTKNKIKL